MGVAGLLELKNLSRKYQVYKVNCPNDEFLCKPLYNVIIIEKEIGNCEHDYNNLPTYMCNVDRVIINTFFFQTHVLKCFLQDLPQDHLPY